LAIKVHSIVPDHGTHCTSTAEDKKEDGHIVTKSPEIWVRAIDPADEICLLAENQDYQLHKISQE
jgi:hypothetical protein